MRAIGSLRLGTPLIQSSGPCSSLLRPPVVHVHDRMTQETARGSFLSCRRRASLRMTRKSADFCDQACWLRRESIEITLVDCKGVPCLTLHDPSKAFQLKDRSRRPQAVAANGLLAASVTPHANIIKLFAFSEALSFGLSHGKPQGWTLLRMAAPSS